MWMEWYLDGKKRAYSTSSIKSFTVIFRTYSITIEGLWCLKLDYATKAPNHDSKIEIQNGIS